MRCDSRNDIFDDIPVLLPQGGNGSQDSFRQAGAVAALVAKAAFAPQDGGPQSSLGPIIGRFHPWHKGKGEQCRPQFQQIAAHGLGLGISTRGAFTQKSAQTGSHRNQFPTHSGPGDLTSLIAMIDGKEPFYLSQPPFPQGTGTGFPFGRILELRELWCTKGLEKDRTGEEDVMKAATRR